MTERERTLSSKPAILETFLGSLNQGYQSEAMDGWHEKVAGSVTLQPTGGKDSVEVLSKICCDTLKWRNIQVPFTFKEQVLFTIPVVLVADDIFRESVLFTLSESTVLPAFVHPFERITRYHLPYAQSISDPTKYTSYLSMFLPNPPSLSILPVGHAT